MNNEATSRGQQAPWLYDLLPALLMDFSFYLTLITIQHLLDARGVGPEQLAINMATYSAGYVLLCPIVGAALGGRRRAPIFAGLTLGLTALAGFSQVETLEGYRALLALFSLAAALYWTSLEALIGDESTPASLPRRMKIFNLGWTVGKALGFIVAGQLFERLPEPSHAFALPFALLLLNIAVFARRFAPSQASSEALEAPEAAAAPDASPEAGAAASPGLFALALAANVLCWGTQAAIIGLIPVIGRALDFGPGLGGAMLGLMIASQASCFLVLERWKGWRGQRWPLAAALGLACAAALCLGVASGPLGGFLALGLCGLSLGLSYSSSLYSALSRHGSLATGLHEAGVGSGSLLVPLLLGHWLETGTFLDAWRQVALLLGAPALALLLTLGWRRRAP